MHIVIEIDGAISRLQINRPERKNALTVAMYGQLADALNEAERDQNIRVVLIHGRPDVFSNGNDPEDFDTCPPLNRNRTPFKFMTAISALSKPIVVAIVGPAIGIGTTMLPHCDFVYAAKNAQFQLPFANLGMSPEAGVSFLLPNHVGYRRAAELLMLGEPFSAKTALQIGLVTEMTANGDASLMAATSVARKLATKSPAALSLAKMLMKRSSTEDVARRAHGMRRLHPIFSRLG